MEKEELINLIKNLNKVQLEVIIETMRTIVEIKSSRFIN